MNDNVLIKGSVFQLVEDISIDDDIDTLLDELYDDNPSLISTLNEAEEDVEEDNTQVPQQNLNNEEIPDNNMENNNQEENTKEEQQPEDNEENNEENMNQEENPEEDNNTEEEQQPEDNTEADMENSEEAIKENKERYNYFRIFSEQYDNMKIFIDKVKSFIDNTSESSEKKTVLRFLLDEIFDIKSDLEYLLIDKIHIIDMDSLPTLYTVFSSKANILIDIAEKVLKMESNEDNKN